MIMSRTAVAAALMIGFAGAAQAQTRQVEPAASDFYAIQEGRSVADTAQVYRGAPVPASVSHTVMGLSTPY